MISRPFFLITGFLGSGKTTLLKNIINAYSDEKRIAVIQNEFAPTGIDGIELRRTGKPFEMIELNRGSVFCVCLMSDFVASLRRIIDERSPEVIILEATGLADPIAVVQLLQDDLLVGHVYLSHIWAIIDTPNFLRAMTAVKSVSHQIRIADTVVLNKMDKFTGDLAEIQAQVRRINPFARIETTEYCRITLDGLFDPITEPTRAQAIYDEQGAKVRPSGRPSVASVAVRATQPVDRGKLMDFLRRRESGTYRIKGFIRTIDGAVLAIQSCFGQTEVEEVEGYDGPSELIAIGTGLNPNAFARDFDSLR